MKAQQRPMIAAIAAAAVNRRDYSATYDFAKGTHVHTTVTLKDKSVTAYDHGRGVHYSGTLPSLYDFGASEHFTLDARGKDVQGYAFGCGEHFTATVSGNSVVIYDYETSEHYHFTVS